MSIESDNRQRQSADKLCRRAPSSARAENIPRTSGPATPSSQRPRFPECARGRAAAPRLGDVAGGAVATAESIGRQTEIPRREKRLVPGSRSSYGTTGEQWAGEAGGERAGRSEMKMRSRLANQEAPWNPPLQSIPTRDEVLEEENKRPHQPARGGLGLDMFRLRPTDRPTPDKLRRCSPDGREKRRLPYAGTTPEIVLDVGLHLEQDAAPFDHRQTRRQSRERARDNVMLIQYEGPSLSTRKNMDKKYPGGLAGNKYVGASIGKRVGISVQDFKVHEREECRNPSGVHDVYGFDPPTVEIPEAQNPQAQERRVVVAEGVKASGFPARAPCETRGLAVKCWRTFGPWPSTEEYDWIPGGASLGNVEDMKDAGLEMKTQHGIALGFLQDSCCGVEHLWNLLAIDSRLHTSYRRQAPAEKV
ncbi:hypothetical protein FB451DRAFT_1175678 [Mycena latifolia]|nr:hypothetical protein FB451DRAFT_1175678 [Mycena latifolia]